MNNILKTAALTLAVTFAAVSCIKETIPVGGTVTQAQVSASKTALNSMINSMTASLTTSGTGGYATSYGDHTDFGIPGIHLRLEHMLEDIATMADNPYYNRFYAYDLNMAQGSTYTYCAYFWDMYYTWIRLVNDVIASLLPVIEDGTADAELKNSIGQAYMWRAWCYLDLARLYEPKTNAYTDVRNVLGLTVPIVDENTVLEQTKYNPRVSREVMYDFILSDLAKAEKYLDHSVKNFSSPNIMALYGIYARLYLELGATYKEYDKKDPDVLTISSDEAYAKAAEYARKVIDESGKTPLTQTQWEDPVNGFNNGSANNAWIWGLKLSSENLNNLLTFVSHMSCEASWGYARYAHFGVNKTLYDAIPATDFRKHSWLDPDMEDFYAYKFAGTEADKENFLSGGSQAAKAYQSIKFRPAQGECSDFNVGNAADYCLMRIEEMYFIEMEAQANLALKKGVGLLQDFMTEYRDKEYSRISSSVGLTDFLTEMLLQKRVEFWGEGILFYDYKRLGAGITRKYAGSNHAGVFQLNSVGRSPQWNIVVTRAEFQSNTAITDATNNPDPSEKL